MREEQTNIKSFPYAIGFIEGDNDNHFIALVKNSVMAQLMADSINQFRRDNPEYGLKPTVVVMIRSNNEVVE